VAASRNQLLVRVYAVVERAREGELWGSLKRRNDSRERRAVYQSEHEAIVEALVARELAAALAAMEFHLVRVEANLLGAAAQ
jgi:DNA-binding FadR family transcriptional regulator